MTFFHGLVYCYEDISQEKCDYLISWNGPYALALSSTGRFREMSCGYSGFSDGWQDLKDNLKMDWHFEKVEDGNIAMTAEIDLDGDFTLALSFGRNDVEAVLEANATLGRGYELMLSEYIKEWHGYLSGLEDLTKEAFDGGRLYGISVMMMLKAHEDKNSRGGVIASLSVPWGDARSDAEAGGYHFVWPRDLVKTAFGFLATGDTGTPVNILKFLKRAQKADGSWPQNMWLDGRPYLSRRTA